MSVVNHHNVVKKIYVCFYQFKLFHRKRRVCRSKTGVKRVHIWLGIITLGGELPHLYTYIFLFWETQLFYRGKLATTYIHFANHMFLTMLPNLCMMLTKLIKFRLFTLLGGLWFHLVYSRKFAHSLFWGLSDLYGYLIMN